MAGGNVKVKNSSLDIHLKKRMYFNMYLIPYTKMYPKCIIDLNVKPKIIKLGGNFYDLELGKYSIDVTPKA